MLGYRLADADKNNLDVKYFCNLCTLLLRDPIQTSCGHFYCKSCLEQRFENPGSYFCCTVDGTVLHKNYDIFKDGFMRREVLRLTVSCTFHDEGCTWTGEVHHLEDHAARCKFMKVPCVHEPCRLLVKKGDLYDHLRMECICRQEKCRICDKEISHIEMKEHLRSEHNHLHEEMDNLRDVVDDVLHEQDNFRDVVDDLRDQQHGLRDEQRDLRDRLQNAVEELHERLVGQETLENRQDDLRNAIQVVQETLGELFRSRDEQKIEGELVNDKLANLSRALSTLNRSRAAVNQNPQNPEIALACERQESDDVEGLAENTQEMTRGMDRQVESMEDTLATRRLTSLENRMADHEVLVDRAIEEVRHDKESAVRRQEQRIESIEHTLALRNVTLADLEEYVRQQEFSSYDGQLLWKISDYARRRHDAVTGRLMSFYSPPFYTSRHGYKMCARIYLNGDGIGKGTHISVSFVVMRGQYDALLRWPFRQKVTFMLLDQDNVEHAIDAFRPDPSSSSFQRPTGEMNIASGCPTFCSLSELNNHAYIRDDTMFLKIIVDTSD